MEGTTVVIKKYPNRRLYDTSARRYVNLEDLAAMIRQGREIQVVDARTGEDRTRVILTQIITEDAKGQPTGLPIDLLRQLIVTSDRAGQEFIMSYLKSAVETYQKVQESVETRLSDVRSAALTPLHMVKDFLTGSPPPAAPSAAEAERDELRRQVAELKARLAKPKPKRKRKKVG